MIRFHEEFQRYLPDDWCGEGVMLIGPYYLPFEPLKLDPPTAESLTLKAAQEALYEATQHEKALMLGGKRFGSFGVEWE